MDKEECWSASQPAQGCGMTISLLSMTGTWANRRSISSISIIVTKGLLHGLGSTIIDLPVKSACVNKLLAKATIYSKHKTTHVIMLQSI